MIKPDFNKGNGLIPVIVQDYKTNEVLMLAYMNEESWMLTIKNRKATYFSRSRNKLWLKGEKSKNFQEVKEIYIDCDNDTLLLKIKQIGGASCHLGYKSCFFRDENGLIINGKVFDPEEKYNK